MLLYENNQYLPLMLDEDDKGIPLMLVELSRTLAWDLEKSVEGVFVWERCLG